MIPQEFVRSGPDTVSRTGMTYQEVADELGVSVRTVQNWEDDALTKCLFWCIDNGYRLEDLLSR